MKRHLTLRREALTELAGEDLASVCGAASIAQACLRPITEQLANTYQVCWTQPYAGATNCVC